jgi:hypothetical protein
MESSVPIRRLRTASLFRLCLFGWGFGIAPIAALAAIASLFGGPGVTIAGASYTGIAGFFLGLIAAPLIGLQMAVLNVAVISLGWWIYRSIFGPASLVAVADHEPV